jgi:hypothetical protein
MSLLDLWKSSRTQLEDKHVQQIIAFAGKGDLKDGSTGSLEFREFLAHVPAELLGRYATDCLETSFSNSGLALQDVVNQVGKRLGFKVADGRYRGAINAIGFDGLWTLPDSHAIVVEVKTTDAYRIDLGSVAGYRRALTQQGTIHEDQSSVLIVVGRQDTGELEAQIRGSRHAWDIRLISVDALLRLMFLRERVEDPAIIQRISAILVPREFTRLDEIVDVVFSTAEQAAQPEPESVAETSEEGADAAEPKEAPAAFHAACIAKVEAQFGHSLIRRTRSGYSSPDQTMNVICAVSRAHDHLGHLAYWFAFHPHQRDFIEASPKWYLVLGCGSAERVLAIPIASLRPWLDQLWQTHRSGTFYWHFRIHDEKGRLTLDRKGGEGRIDVSAFLIDSKGAA